MINPAQTLRREALARSGLRSRADIVEVITRGRPPYFTSMGHINSAKVGAGLRARIYIYIYVSMCVLVRVAACTCIRACAYTRTVCMHAYELRTFVRAGGCVCARLGALAPLAARYTTSRSTCRL